jgi:ATP-dependent Clp protease ATP-binding subunit ClpC
MRVTLPVLFERAEGSSVFKVRPLLFPGPICEGKILNRALNRLARELRRTFSKLSAQQLVACCTYPAITIHRIRVQGMLRKSTFNEKFLALAFPSEMGRLCFLPAFEPDSLAWTRAGVQAPKALRHGLWMVLDRGEALEARVTVTLEKVFRQHPQLQAAAFKIHGWTDVTPLRLNAEIISHLKVKEEEVTLGQLLLGGTTDFEGAQELSDTSTNLSQLYPEQLQRAFLRSQATESLEQLLWARQKRAILVLGPSGVGKTALVHELVFRHEQKREKNKKKRGQREIFELSPRLVIAGMSYVGQWQERLLAILKEVEKRDHVLFVSDLIDLFSAGRSANSDVSLAAVLKPYIQRGRIRFVGEASPEVFRVLKERDRSFADLFKIVRLEPCDDSTTLSILIRAQRPLERDYHVHIRADALARTVEYQRRFVRSRVFPGKAVSFLEALARRSSGQPGKDRTVDGSHVLRLFAEWSGLSLGILNQDARLPRELVLKALESRVIGQREACEAIAETVLVTQAGLNDPQKPLACFLFIGPTGVGKTEAAKAAASYLYGSKDRLMRFDMNEFPDASSLSRLIGTSYRGDGEAADGLLTGRVRLRPFSVILFDEIEKAHPSIYDLLLQVLDEGHLTDAAGRVADFSNCIIILTSNLGVLRARGVADLPGGHDMSRGIYREEVERFFRPEFVNRLDRIIPFSSLRPAEIRDIARLVVEDALGREGLRRRRVVLNLDEGVINRLVTVGTDEDLGARPLKRAVTQMIMEPLGRQLAATIPAQTTVAWVRTDQRQGIVVSLQILDSQPLQPIPEGERLNDAIALGQIVEEGLSDLRARIRDAGTGPRVIDLSDIRPSVRMRYRLLEEVDDLFDQFDSVRSRSTMSPGRRFRGSEAHGRKRRTTREKIRRNDAPGLVYEPDDDLDDFLDHQLRAAHNPDKQVRKLQEMRRYAAALSRLAPALKADKESALLVGLWSMAPLRGQKFLDLLADAYREIANLFGHEAALVKLDPELASLIKIEQHYVVLWVKGARPDLIFAGEQGNHVFQPRGTGPVPLAVHCFAAEQTDSLCPQASRDFVDALLSGERALSAGTALRHYEILDDPSAPRGEADFKDLDLDRLVGIESKDATPLSSGLKRSSNLPKSYGKLEILLKVTDHRSGMSGLFKWPLRDLLPFLELLYHVFPLPAERMVGAGSAEEKINE